MVVAFEKGGEDPPMHDEVATPSGAHSAGSVKRLPKLRLQSLLDILWERGFRVLGPVVRNGGVVFDEIRLVADMPIGLREEQHPGRYRLVPGVAAEIFGVVNGPGSLKPSFFAPEEPLVELRKEQKGFSATPFVPDAPRLAFLGVRACDLAALAVQDRIFLYDRFRDTHYAARRAQVLLIGVNCTRSAATCFCVSMHTGPEVTRGHDLVLTESDDVFVLQSATPAGEAIAADLHLDACGEGECAAAAAAVAACAAGMQRQLDTSDLPQLLYDEPESPRWDDVARRCLSCTNCTMVCPTCFCHTVVDVTAIDGQVSQRVRQWDSCFSYEHAHIHGKNFRPHIRERYRQWLTHKLASWIDQFGSSGCVGCGRCITWCPVGIDLTEEVAAIRAQRVARGAS
jgi:sulfhydrogenase subunit beta (sulfur reductase)